MFFFFSFFKWAAAPPPTPSQQNIPPSTTAGSPLLQAAGAGQAGNEPTGDVDSDKDDADVFLVESIEVDGDAEMSQGTVTTALQVNSAPWENGDQLKGSQGNGEAKHPKLHEDKRELQPSKKAAAPAVEKAPETNREKPPQRLCSITCSSPLRISRKQNPAEEPKVPLDKPPAPQPAGKAHKEVGEMSPLGRMRNSSGLLVAHSYSCSCQKPSTLRRE